MAGRFSNTKKSIRETLNILWCAFCQELPIKDRVLFYTTRSDGELRDNIKCVYDALDLPRKSKPVFAHIPPHGKFIKPRLYYLMFTCKVIVADDYMRYLRNKKLREGQKVLQLWHAEGAFKKFGLDAPSHLTKREEQKNHSQYTAVAVSSESCRDHYAGAFGIDKGRCLAIGTPRTDLLISGDAKEKMRADILGKIPLLSERKRIYLYCPTFRDVGEKHVAADVGIDWKTLDYALEEDELFIIRNHPLIDYKTEVHGLSNVIDCSNESTLQLLTACSVLVTDYSSVIFDAALLKKPMVFFCPDIKRYERGFYLNYPEDLPGEAVMKVDDLLPAVRRANENPPVEKLEAFIDEQMGACDGHSTERVVDLIKSWL